GAGGPAGRGGGAGLRGPCLWREVGGEAVVPPERTDRGAGRADVVTRVVGCGEARPFAGLCRAKHAVVEASILASRLRRLPREALDAELDRLGVLVEKTRGARERGAMAVVRAWVARQAPAT